MNQRETSLIKPYDVLVNTARQVCAEEAIDFDNSVSSVRRAMLCYWCSICRRTHPLNNIVLMRRKKICCVCNNNVKLYSNSNKYGKIRKKIFYRYIQVDAAAAITLQNVHRSSAGIPIPRQG